MRTAYFINTQAPFVLNRQNKRKLEDKNKTNTFFYIFGRFISKVKK